MTGNGEGCDRARGYGSRWFLGGLWWVRLAPLRQVVEPSGWRLSVQGRKVFSRWWRRHSSPQLAAEVAPAGWLIAWSRSQPLAGCSHPGKLQCRSRAVT
jgi:hypothetical protein